MSEKDAPLTDEDLTASIASLRLVAATLAETPAHPRTVEAIDRLVREIRRLRSDEWLRAAADDLTRSYKGIARGQWHAEILAALRKHRDGKA